HRMRARAPLFRRRRRARSGATLLAPYPPRCAQGGMLTVIVQAVWLALPVILGGVVHIAIIKLDLLPALARVPLDGGMSLRGRRVLGDHKTVRGAATMIAA